MNLRPTILLKQNLQDTHAVWAQGNTMVSVYLVHQELTIICFTQSHVLHVGPGVKMHLSGPKIANRVSLVPRENTTI